MKLIVNYNTPVTVEDPHGNILFQWLPQLTKKATVNIETCMVDCNQSKAMDLFKALEEMIRTQ